MIIVQESHRDCPFWYGLNNWDPAVDPDNAYYASNVFSR